MLNAVGILFINVHMYLDLFHLLSSRSILVDTNRFHFKYELTGIIVYISSNNTYHTISLMNIQYTITNNNKTAQVIKERKGKNILLKCQSQYTKQCQSDKHTKRNRRNGQ